MQATFETRIKDLDVYPMLDAVAELYGRVERVLFVDRYARHRQLSELKREYLTRFGLTARQFNAIAATLEGKVKAARVAARHGLSDLSGRIAAAKEKIAALEERLGRDDPAEARRRLRFTLHQKRRRLSGLQDRLAAAKAEAARTTPGVCFGGRSLFRAQFHLRENGYATHAEWRKAWQAARSCQVLCLGSKDETGGNQTATLDPKGTLRLRVPPALEHRFGHWVRIQGIRFPYGQDVIDSALAAGQAITFRFVRRRRKRGWAWYLQATTERPAAAPVTDRKNGCLGVDLNPGLVAATLIDRHGNPVHAKHLPVRVRGRRRAQAEAQLADAVADLVSWARGSSVPIAVERLDFKAKKERLEVAGGKRYARMLSNFAYKRFLALLLARAAREGMEVILVNPAFTSVIGAVKFGDGYGLSPHAAAACAIARRSMRFGERLRSRSKSALPLPVRNRGRHVWSDWGRLNRWLRKQGGIAKLPGRRPSEGSWGRGIPLSLAAHARRQAAGHGPLGDDLAPAPGRDSPAQTVGNAVRPA